ncbi:hypothetical protein DNTS_016178 [Danionella cerebrum]|uniref:Caspase activity and apoptosis inhibitor 1 n=1 Tax=Danionella cerebrum TaxID=2873325 RepID=A0A553MRF5_9TELE|nr:hypothetical protein DNTS_016178 [Danionella translucida]
MVKTMQEKSMLEGKKREKENKRAQTYGELNDGQVKKRNTEAEQVLSSDLEEGGLDLTRSLKPISAYTDSRPELLDQCFHGCSFEEIKKLCWDQLEKISETHLLQILEGKELSENAAPEEKSITDTQQDSIVDSTSSLKETPEAEEKQGSGEDSDVLSINAEMDDSDIEPQNNIDQKAEKEKDPAPPHTNPPSSSSKPREQLQQDIDRSVRQILDLETCTEFAETAEEHKESNTLTETLESETQGHHQPHHPSAQQLDLLELEMRARAIKALMKANTHTRINTLMNTEQQELPVHESVLSHSQ